jgi:hypothetical protein
MTQVGARLLCEERASEAVLGGLEWGAVHPGAGCAGEVRDGNQCRVDWNAGRRTLVGRATCTADQKQERYDVETTIHVRWSGLTTGVQLLARCPARVLAQSGASDSQLQRHVRRHGAPRTLSSYDECAS